MAARLPYVKWKSGELPWATYMKRQVFRQNNCINGIFTGTPGSGKSWAMLALCEQVDPNFTLEGNWFFKAGDMMAAISKYYDKPTYKKGKIWCLDEAGIDLNNLSFHDAINKGLNAFFQTARHRNYIFFMSVPHKQFISKGVRTLVTAHFTAHGWTKNDKTIVKPSITEYNGDVGTSGKTYNKCLRVVKGGRKYRCETMMVPKPSERIVKEYEQMKREFTSNLFDNITQQIRKYEGDDGEVTVTKTQNEVIELLQGKKTRQEVADALGRSYHSIHQTIDQLKKKGFKIYTVREKGTGKVTHTEVREEPANWVVA